MIWGIGVDMIEIGRIEKSMKTKEFLLRVFSEKEQELFGMKKHAPQTIAANFCGKEAFSKALGTGVRGFSLREVSILRNEEGAPYIFLEGKAKQIAQEKGLHFQISLSHTKESALAFVTAERYE